MRALRQLRKLLGRPSRPRAPYALRKFDAAGTDRLAASWTSGGVTSINSDIYYALTTMRARARDLQQNNEYAAHFIRTLVNNVVGPTGFKFQSQAQRRDGTLDQQDNDTIEARYTEWGKVGQCDVTRRLSMPLVERLAVEQLVRDGETIIRKVRGYANAQRYALEFLDPDLLDVDYNEEPRDGLGRIIMGVELDDFAAPVAYHFLTQHPSPWNYSSVPRSVERVRVPADQIIHLFVPTRPRQVRGFPWMHAGMRALRDLGGYREAAIIASRIGAAKTGFWRSEDGTSAPIDGIDNVGNAVDLIEPGKFQQIGQDITLETWDPTYPHEMFEEFQKAMLRGLAGAFGISYHALNNDLESVNLSSARIGQQNERDLYSFVQNFVVEGFHENYYPEWLELQLPAMRLPMSRFDKFNAPHWSPRRWASADPLKDAQTNALNLGMTVTSPQQVIRSMGLDPDEVLREIEQWRERLEEAGIPYTHTSNVVQESDSEDTQDDQIIVP